MHDTSSPLTATKGTHISLLAGPHSQGGSVSVSGGSSSGTRTLCITFTERFRIVATHNGVANVVGVTGTNAAITVNYSGSSSNDRVANFVAIGN